MSVTVRFEILFWLYGPEKFPGLSRNGPRVVRKPVNANSGLKVNRSIHFPCEMFSIAYVFV